VGRRGRKRQLDLESEYWKLLQSGVRPVAACKALGIGRKTSYRWRAENGGLPLRTTSVGTQVGTHGRASALPHEAAVQDLADGVLQVPEPVDVGTVAYRLALDE
jgi:hypothetical protein